MVSFVGRIRLSVLVSVQADRQAGRCAQMVLYAGVVQHVDMSVLDAYR